MDEKQKDEFRAHLRERESEEDYVKGHAHYEAHLGVIDGLFPGIPVGLTVQFFSHWFGNGILGYAYSAIIGAIGGAIIGGISYYRDGKIKSLKYYPKMIEIELDSELTWERKVAEYAKDQGISSEHAENILLTDVGVHNVCIHCDHHYYRENKQVCMNPKRPALYHFGGSSEEYTDCRNMKIDYSSYPAPDPEPEPPHSEEPFAPN